MSEFASYPPPTPPAYRTAVARRSSSLATGWKVLIGCGILVALAGAAFLAWVLYLGTRTVPDGVDVEVETPVSVVQGESFTIVARVTNGDDRGHSLVDLDVADSFLDGVVVHATEPPFAESMHVPFANVRSYTYDLALPVGKTVEVRLEAFAAFAGDHEGNFDFCIDSELVCASYPVRLIVLPAGEPAPPPAAEAANPKGGA